MRWIDTQKLARWQAAGTATHLQLSVVDLLGPMLAPLVCRGSVAAAYSVEAFARLPKAVSTIFDREDYARSNREAGEAGQKEVENEKEERS